MREGNILTLWDDPVFKPGDVPEYPTFTIELDKEGNPVRDMDRKFIPNWDDNLIHRADIRNKCNNSAEFREVQYLFCKSNILYFINTFCWTYDPRLKEPMIPFVTYPFQDDLITWCLWLINEHESGLIEKSRDMGATWCMEAIAVYMTIFFDGMVDYQLSLKEDDVDNRSSDSLLGKYRFILSNLPDWMRGGWKEKENGVDNKMLIKIPDTQSMVRGQLTGGQAGRSGRSTRAFYDEFAFIDDSDKVLKASSSLSPSCLFLSTPNGKGNAFYRMASSPFVKKKSLHWKLHPLKNDEWMKKERGKAQYTDEVWAQEHDINYEQSTKGRVYPEFVSFSDDEFDWCHLNTGNYYDYDPNFDVYVGMDFGIADPTSVVFAQIKPSQEAFSGYTKECLVFFSEYEESNKYVGEWVKFLKGLQWSEDNPEGYVYRHIVGDYRSGNQRTPTGKTWIEYLGQHGFHVVGRYRPEHSTLMEVKKLLQKPGALAVNSEKCPNLMKAFQNWSFPVDKKTGLVPPGAKPKHDQWSHSMKAVCYLVDYVYGQKKENDQITEDSWDFRVLGGSRMI